MASEEIFAKEEAKLGKNIHFHDGVWWVQSAPFYCKPVNEFRPLRKKSAKPNFLKAMGGYSHQVCDDADATRSLAWNVLEGENLMQFSIERLNSKRRNIVRGGLRDCQVVEMRLDTVILEQMRQINISQAQRFIKIRNEGSFLPPDYYETHSEQWREGVQKLFSHSGHQFLGAFVNDNLAAYIDILKIEDTWLFGAVKSHYIYLKHHPVDALYYHILTMASKSNECKRVVNGGGNEPPSLTHFKEEYLLEKITKYYYSHTLISLETLRRMRTFGFLHRSRKLTKDSKESHDDSVSQSS